MNAVGWKAATGILFVLTAGAVTAAATLFVGNTEWQEHSAEQEAQIAACQAVADAYEQAEGDIADLSSASASVVDKLTGSAWLDDLSVEVSAIEQVTENVQTRSQEVPSILSQCEG